MSIETELVFANSCGKIYTDRIILASSNKESSYGLATVKKLTLKVRLETQSMLFILLPALLFIVPYFSDSEDTFARILFIGLGIALMALAIAKATKKYTLSIVMQKGPKKSIGIWEGNKKDARKFADMGNALLSKRSTAVVEVRQFQPESEFTISKQLSVK